MIKTYTHNGREFNTLTIPKGTALFRGIHYDQSTPYNIFADLLGVYSKGTFEIPPTFNIAPTMNVFFYPAPYVSACIDSYNIHIMYVTNYDIELLMLVNPSDMHRGIRNTLDTSGIVTTCTSIGSVDKCGLDMKIYDACLTDTAFTHFPNIAGYIALANNDVSYFVDQHKRLMTLGKKTEIIQILPCISSNSRGLIGVPEIVIHPLHLRRNTCAILRARFADSAQIVKYCISRYSQYNFFPLLYFTNTGVYNFSNLISDKLILRLQNTTTTYNVEKNQLMLRMKRVLNRILTPYGYNVNGKTYFMSIDIRTGFYIISDNADDTASAPIVKNNYGKLRLIDYSNDKLSVVPYSYSLSDKHKLMKLISLGNHVDENAIEQYLNSINMSLTTQYVLKKGDRNTYMKRFHIDNVLSRDDIIPVTWRRR